MTLSEATVTIARAAVAAERKTGFPAEIIAAQAALESGWLAAVKGNNVFGWKAYAGCPGRQLIQSTEWLDPAGVAAYQNDTSGRCILKFLEKQNGNRKLYAVMDWFATFPSIPDAFAAHVERLQSLTRYIPALVAYREATGRPADRLRALAEGIHRAGYSTAPDYADKVMQIATGKRLTDALRLARG